MPRWAYTARLVQRFAHVVDGALRLARAGGQKVSDVGDVRAAWRVHVEPRWAPVAVADVRFTDVQQWVTNLSVTRGATTVIRAYGVLAAVLDDAVRDRWLLTNPARGVDLPRKTRAEHVYLNHQQVHDLAAASGQYSTMVLLLAYCGLRWGEAAALRVKDCNLLRRRINVVQNTVEVGSKVHVGTPKSHKRRTVPIPAFLADKLARLCEGKASENLLFPGPTGGHLRPPTTTDGWLWTGRSCERVCRG